MFNFFRYFTVETEIETAAEIAFNNLKAEMIADAQKRVAAKELEVAKYQIVNPHSNNNVGALFLHYAKINLANAQNHLEIVSR